MATIGMGAVLGVIIAGVIVFFVDFQNPSSEVLVVIMCVTLCTAALNAVRRRPGKAAPSERSKP